MSAPDHGLARLVTLMDRLRDPDGCPWDRAQTLETLKPYLVEEAYEVLEAMDGDPQAHCEELGDLLLQIVFHARLRREEGLFSIDDVVRGISDKLVRRHPHVFGEDHAATAAEGLASWERAKEAEGKPGDALAGVPSSLPAALRAQRVSEKAAALGFDWSGPEGVADKVREELAEVEEALAAGRDEAALAHEIGDLLFAAVNLARHVGVDAETALRGAGDRFLRRFRGMSARLAAEGRAVEECGAEELDEAWEAEKAGEETG